MRGSLRKRVCGFSSVRVKTWEETQMSRRDFAGRSRRFLAIALAGLLVAAVVPLAARASVASRSGSSIFISGGREFSRITVGAGSFGQSTRDSAGITAAVSCEQVALDMVTCGAFSANVRIYAQLGGGNDRFGSIALVARIAVLDGGAGNDQLYGDAWSNEIRGGAGSDVIDGSVGNDILIGGPGRDRISGGAGADIIYADDGAVDAVDCGDGRDLVRADPGDVTVRCERVVGVES